MRGILVLLAHDSVGGNPNNVFPAAVAVELLHGFTLMHDDIMDSSPIRHGRPTVHKHWNQNAAILSGDAMMALAISQLHSCCHISSNPADVIQLLGKGLLDVCEGQALDLELAVKPVVSEAEYFNMIELKTARLLEMCCQIGCRLGNGTLKQYNALTDFGRSLGIAFQMKDDLLDLFGSPKFGKTKGGDLIEGKRTWMMLEAKKRHPDNSLVSEFYQNNGLNPQNVPTMIDLLEGWDIVQDARTIVNHHTTAAFHQLDQLPPGIGTTNLRLLAESLITRTI